MPPVDALRAQARPEPCAERIDPFRGAAEDLQTRGGAAVLRVGTAQQDRQSTEFPIQQEQPVVDDATAFVRAYGHGPVVGCGHRGPVVLPVLQQIPEGQVMPLLRPPPDDPVDALDAGQEDRCVGQPVASEFLQHRRNAIGILAEVVGQDVPQLFSLMVRQAGRCGVGQPGEVLQELLEALVHVWIVAMDGRTGTAQGSSDSSGSVRWRAMSRIGTTSPRNA